MKNENKKFNWKWNEKIRAPINVLPTALHNNCVAAHALSSLAAANLFHYSFFIGKIKYIFICHFRRSVFGHHTHAAHPAVALYELRYIAFNVKCSALLRAMPHMVDSISIETFFICVFCRSIAFEYYYYFSDCVWIVYSVFSINKSKKLKSPFSARTHILCENHRAIAPCMLLSNCFPKYWNSRKRPRP